MTSSTGPVPEVVVGIRDADLLTRASPTVTSSRLRLRMIDDDWTSDADAVFVSFMAGLELSPEISFRESQVIAIGPGARKPPFVVTGIAFRGHDRLDDPSDELRLQFEAVMQAVETFNRTHPARIQRLAIDLEWLSPSEVDPGAAIRAIDSILNRLTSRGHEDQ